jgi:hypothetical protein
MTRYCRRRGMSFEFGDFSKLKSVFKMNSGCESGDLVGSFEEKKPEVTKNLTPLCTVHSRKNRICSCRK